MANNTGKLSMNEAAGIGLTVADYTGTAENTTEADGIFTSSVTGFFFQAEDGIRDSP